MEHWFFYCFKELPINFKDSVWLVFVFKIQSLHFIGFWVFFGVGFDVLGVESDLCIDLEEEIEGDDESKTEYPCPFCTEDFDLVGLCCHIDEEHPIEANSGVCIFLSACVIDLL